jgi:hypothetical protein
LRIDNLSVGMRSGVHPAALGHHDCRRLAQRTVTTRWAVFTMPIRAFTIPIRVFTMGRSWRSRWADPRVHDRAVPAWCAKIKRAKRAKS